MGAILLATLLFFIYLTDDMFRLDLLPRSWERIVRLMSWLAGVFGGSGAALSIVLSLYRLSERKGD